MHRLQSELSRLYLLSPPAALGASLPEPSAEAGSPVRLMVLELAAPADWSELSKVWRGVQAELGLPAPAIAVSGSDGMQLWFSLQAPTSLASAARFLTGLRTRYLAGIAQQRIRLQPASAEQPFPVPSLPSLSASTGNWSAFIAADLAAVFVDTPWLDVEPSAEGQADLLSRLQSIKPAAFEAALRTLSQPPAGEAAAAQAQAPSPKPKPKPSTSGRPAESADRAADLDPQRFLQQVLNDDAVELALRVEAAKALLRLQRHPPEVNG